MSESLAIHSTQKAKKLYTNSDTNTHSLYPFVLQLDGVACVLIVIFVEPVVP